MTSERELFDLLETEIRVGTVSDGYPLHYRFWPARTETPRGYVVALHGIQSHSGWYRFTGSAMAEAGYEVYFMDRRGSGANRHARGHAPSADRLVLDIVELLELAHDRRKAHRSEAPVVLFGLSLGGRLATAAALREPSLVDGLVLAYPALETIVRASPGQLRTLDVIARLGGRRLKVPIPLGDPALFTASIEWQEFIRRDPLSIHRASVAFVQAIQQLQTFTLERFGELRMPLLMMLAGQDVIIDNEATRRLLDRLPAGQALLREYPQSLHTIEFEPERPAYLADLQGWLTQLAARRKAEPIRQAVG